MGARVSVNMANIGTAAKTAGGLVPFSTVSIGASAKTVGGVVSQAG